MFQSSIVKLATCWAYKYEWKCMCIGSSLAAHQSTWMTNIIEMFHVLFFLLLLLSFGIVVKENTRTKVCSCVKSECSSLKILNTLDQMSMFRNLDYFRAVSFVISWSCVYFISFCWFLCCFFVIFISVFRFFFFGVCSAFGPILYAAWMLHTNRATLLVCFQFNAGWTNNSMNSNIAKFLFMFFFLLVVFSALVCFFPLVSVCLLLLLAAITTKKMLKPNVQCDLLRLDWLNWMPFEFFVSASFHSIKFHWNILFSLISPFFLQTTSIKMTKKRDLFGENPSFFFYTKKKVLNTVIILFNCSMLIAHYIISIEFDAFIHKLSFCWAEKWNDK